jgi:hypothetical protein
MRGTKRSAALAVVFVGMFVGSARAQETVVVRVPFSFVVRGEECPAGRYNITTEEGMIVIRGIDNSAGIYAMATPADGSDPIGVQPALVFVPYQNTRRLSHIWQSSQEGFALEEPSGVPRHATAAPGAPIVVAASVISGPASESAMYSTNPTAATCSDCPPRPIR